MEKVESQLTNREVRPSGTAGQGTGEHKGPGCEGWREPSHRESRTAGGWGGVVCGVGQSGEPRVPVYARPLPGRRGERGAEPAHPHPQPR